MYLTRYAAERMQRELRISDLRLQFKLDVLHADNPREKAEDIIAEYLIGDQAPVVEWDFYTEEDASRSRHVSDYTFVSYPSNNVIEIYGSAVEQYVGDDEGNYINGEGYDFYPLTEEQYGELLHDLDLDYTTQEE